MQLIYLDHNATTTLAPEVFAVMKEIYATPFQASAVHQLGRQANKILDEARDNLKKLLNAKNYEVIFTGSATEATNTVFAGCDVERIFFSGIEHASVFNCRPKSKEIVEIGALENGLIDVATLDEAITKQKFLTSAMLANNETGAIQPIAEIAKLTHQKGGLIHCDIVQAVGKIDVDLEKLNVDFASISAHKIHGPQGVGALLIRKGLDINPLIFGSGQEKSKRAGTHNVAGIAGFGKAAEIAAVRIDEYKNLQNLRDFMEAEIKKIAGENVKIFATEVARLPNTSYIALRNCDAQTQVINFDLKGICVSAGAACSSGSLKQSRVLGAMKIEPEFANGAIRVSIGLGNNRDEIEKFIAAWKEMYDRVQNKKALE
jgi:cysteine desulfurase